MKYISKNHVAMSLMLQVNYILKIKSFLFNFNFFKYYRQNDVNKLCDILNQENLNSEHAMSLIKVAYKQTVIKFIFFIFENE